jgi:uncharacterized protein
MNKVLMALVKAYRLLLSPWLGGACRFYPTCSAYTLEALQVHGAIKGSYLGLHRICRCQPFCQGGIDPVPPKNTKMHLVDQEAASISVTPTKKLT